MLILLLCIFCNVLLAIIFKAFERFQIDNLNAIIFNYFASIGIASLILGRFAIPADLFQKPWFYGALLLGILFIVGFNILGLSFQKAGVALTIIITKMSLAIPVIYAVTIYDESLGLFKVLGLIAAVAAIVLVNLPENDSTTNLISAHKSYLWLPIIAFLMSGVIEMVLYYVQAEDLLKGDDIVFVVSSFAIAGVLGVLYSIYRIVSQNKFVQMKDIMGGIILGIPNFFTIYLLLYLLKNGWQGSVLFPINNIGILILTTLVAIVLYKEKMSSKKMLGLVFAAMAIILIGIS